MSPKRGKIVHDSGHFPSREVGGNDDKVSMNVKNRGS